jgi:tonB-dependent receptor plug
VNRQYINRRGLINPYFGMEMNISLGKSKLAN